MTLKVQLLRAVPVLAEQLLVIAKVSDERLFHDHKTERERAQELERKIKEEYGPMAPRFKLYWPGSVGRGSAYATVEVGAFEVKEPDVPSAGLMTMDALNEKEILLADGALLSELCRIGIFMDAKKIGWRLIYQTNGN